MLPLVVSVFGRVVPDNAACGARLLSPAVAGREAEADGVAHPLELSRSPRWLHHHRVRGAHDWPGRFRLLLFILHCVRDRRRAVRRPNVIVIVVLRVVGFFFVSDCGGASVWSAPDRLAGLPNGLCHFQFVTGAGLRLSGPRAQQGWGEYLKKVLKVRSGSLRSATSARTKNHNNILFVRFLYAYCLLSF